MTDAAASTAAAIIAAREEDKVLPGKEGWLFLAKDTNHVIDQHTGRLRFTEKQLNDWRRILETRTAWLEQRGTRHLFLVPPNPHAVYEELLPDSVVVVAERPILQLRKHLLETGSFASFIYPIGALRAAKRNGPVYSQTDTHWNEMGAFVAYKQLIEAVRGLGLRARSLARGRLVVTAAAFSGDLGTKMRPQQESMEIYARVTKPEAEYAYDNRVRFTGRRVDYICKTAPPTTCLIYGDSFAGHLLPFVAESFGRTIFCQVPNLDFEVLEKERPDVAVGVLNERFMMKLPYDTTYPTLADLEATKMALGKVYAPRPEGLGNRMDTY